MSNAPPLKLSLRWIVFENLAQPGTFVIVDPDFSPRIGAQAVKPTPTMYISQTAEALEAALEHILHLYRGCTRVRSRYTALSDQVQEAVERRHGINGSDVREAA